MFDGKVNVGAQVLANWENLIVVNIVTMWFYQYKPGCPDSFLVQI